MIPDLDAYSRTVLTLYSQMPGTPPRPRRADRLLAAQLHARSIGLDLIEALSYWPPPADFAVPPIVPAAPRPLPRLLSPRR